MYTIVRINEVHFGSMEHGGQVAFKEERGRGQQDNVEENMVEACSRGRGERRTSNVSKIIEAWHYLACSRHSEEARAIRVGESDRRLHWKGKFGPDCEEL